MPPSEEGVAVMMQHTDRPGGAADGRVSAFAELLKDELADLLACFIEMKQLLWNVGPQANLGLDQLMRDAVRDSSRWMDRVAERLCELGIVPSTALTRPLLRPDPSGGCSLDERRVGMMAGHLTSEVAQRTLLRAEDNAMTDHTSRHLLRAIGKELNIYATLARQPERLVR